MLAAPSAVLPACPAKLDDRLFLQFHEEGFLAFEGFLSSSEVEEFKALCSELIAGLHAMALRGETKGRPSGWMGMKNYSGLLIKDPHTEFGMLLEPGVDADLSRETPASLEAKCRKLDSPCKGHPRFAELARDRRLLGILEDILGPEPVLSGSMGLFKPARIGVEKPWHQDAAYFNYVPPEQGVDVWIALDDAEVENGCMHVLPGAHRLGPKKHIHRDDCTIAEGRLDYREAVPVELKAGGLLLFSPLLPHRTPPNGSDRGRRSLQFFYRAKHTRLLEKEAHGRLFVESDGTPASCAAANRSA